MIVIVGGGATGLILAVHLLKYTAGRQIVLVEKNGAVGRGLAYSTTLLDHLLNVRAQHMSALPDDPGHFMHWLIARGLIESDTPFYFAPRKTYGDYLNDLLADTVATHPGRLDILADEAIAATPHQAGVRLDLASGASLEAETLVLATGHDLAPLQADDLAIRLDSAQDSPLDSDAPVLILGTGLSMIDAFLSLEARGHRGPVTALSRRGLLPQRQVLPAPIPFTADELPMGKPPSRFLHWLRAHLNDHLAAGGDWRDVIDGLRPFNQRIWQAWPDAYRRPFLRHAKAWWDTHRHRVAPTIHDRINDAIETGRLAIRAGKLRSMARNGDGIRVTFRPRHSQTLDMLDVARVYDCMGIIRNVELTSHPLLKHLVEAGIAKADPLRLSLAVTRECHLVGRDGTPSERILALGPLTRSEFFEIDAIPEIRVQCAEMAKRIGRISDA